MGRQNTFEIVIVYSEGGLYNFPHTPETAFYAFEPGTRHFNILYKMLMLLKCELMLLKCVCFFNIWVDLSF